MHSRVSGRLSSWHKVHNLIFGTVNVIVVVGHEKLNVEMQRTYGSLVQVVKIPKSGGVRLL